MIKDLKIYHHLPFVNIENANFHFAIFNVQSFFSINIELKESKLSIQPSNAKITRYYRQLLILCNKNDRTINRLQFPTFPCE